MVLRSQTRDAQQEPIAQRNELQRQETLLVNQQDRLLNLRLNEDLDQETFAKKQTELRYRLASIKLQLDVVDRSHDEITDWGRMFLNFRKPFATSGLVPTMQQNVGFWKSSF